MQTSYNTRTVWKVVKLDSSEGFIRKSYSEVEYDTVDAAKRAASAIKELSQFVDNDYINFDVEVVYVPIQNIS